MVLRIVPAGVAASGALALALWLGAAGAGRELDARIPGRDNAPSLGGPQVDARAPAGRLTRSRGVPADIPGSWPRFRGERADGVCRDGAPLARAWGPDGPPVLWEVDVGEGHAGAAIHGGRVYLLDYDRDAQCDALRCLSLADGGEIWRYSYPVRIKRNHGMSRTIPAVTDGYVVSLGPKCHVTCLDSRTGSKLWALDLVRGFGATEPPWYAGQCPLVDASAGGEERAIIASAGDALLMAVDCRTGAIIWRTPNPRGWKMTHTSVVPMELDGRRTYVYAASGGVAGVDASDGSILWETDEWRIKIAAVPSPVPVGAGRIFLCAGYGVGSMMIGLSEADGRLGVEAEFRLADSVFGSENHTPVLYEDHLYGVRPSGELVCLALDGSVLWSSGQARRFGRGLGPWLVAAPGVGRAGGLIYVMDGEGTLTLAEATPAGYRERARAKVLDGHDSWGPMAMASGRLIVRSLTRMACLDVGEN